MRLPVVYTILLSWNRPQLLTRTIRSYYETVRVPHKLMIVDNGSGPETVKILKKLAKEYPFTVEFLNDNIGGRAFNLFLDKTGYEYMHFSENDLEYRPGWDQVLIEKLAAFPEVGQLSLFSPHPETEKGEISTKKSVTLIERKELSLYLAKLNVGTTCIVRKELIENGLKWKNYTRKGIHFPSDGHFSTSVKRMGWQVAWNDKHLVTNWGHNIVEFQKELDYYVNGYESKHFVGLDGWNKRLKEHGYSLCKQKDGTYKIVPYTDA